MVVTHCVCGAVFGRLMKAKPVEVKTERGAISFPLCGSCKKQFKHRTKLVIEQRIIAFSEANGGELVFTREQREHSRDGV